MKTLAEQLKEIRDLKVSVNEKKEMLIKIGLRPADVRSLEFSGFFNEKTPLTFGVEIECDVFRNRLQEMSNDQFKFYYEGYNHNDNREYFKFVTDGSVTGASPIECVSPILDANTDGFKALENCCSVLNAADARVNKSCGLHVHVGLAGFSDEQVVNIYKNYQKLEELIDSFMARSRRGDGCRWAQFLAEFDYSSCHSPYDVRMKMYRNRYYKVNPMAFERHGTIEFRQHQGSVDYKKISMWVNFCCKLVEWSKKNLFEAEVTSINDVPFLNAEEKAFFAERIEYFATH